MAKGKEGQGRQGKEGRKVGKEIFSSTRPEGTCKNHAKPTTTYLETVQL